MSEKKTPKITVITPSYNQGAFIEATVKSVVEQGYPNLEYLVFDGGSTDQTMEILAKYSDRLDWRSEKDAGQADAVNKGLQKASGEIIGWLNSDDIYYPGALKYVADYFDAHPKVDVVYGQAFNVDANGKILNPYPSKSWDYKKLQSDCYISQPAAFFRKRVIERCGYLKTALQYCMDYEFWLRMGNAGVKFTYVEKILAGARIHQETKSLKHFYAAHAEIVEMFYQTFGHVPNAWMLNYTSAMTKMNNKQSLLHPKSIGLYYKNLWQIICKYHTGFGRVSRLAQSQMMLGKRALNKLFA